MLKFKQFVNESMFGNDVYEGKKIIIPDDLAIWCMNFYSAQNNDLYDYTKIPLDIIKATKKLIRSYNINDNLIYRGFGIEGELKNEIIFQPINNIGISWTFDEDTARAFSEKYENMGMNPYIAKVNYNKLKYIISMDIIMDNITQRQVKMLTNETTIKDMEDYLSESEILVFDTIKLNKSNIEPLW